MKSLCISPVLLHLDHDLAKHRLLGSKVFPRPSSVLSDALQPRPPPDSETSSLRQVRSGSVWSFCEPVFGPDTLEFHCDVSLVLFFLLGALSSFHLRSFFFSLDALPVSLPDWFPLWSPAPGPQAVLPPAALSPVLSAVLLCCLRASPPGRAHHAGLRGLHLCSG